MNTASWLEVPPGSCYPLPHLPYGVIETGKGPHVATRVGESVVDLWGLARLGCFDGLLADPLGTFGAPSLNAFLAQGRPVWQAVRSALTQLLSAPRPEVLTPDALPALMFDAASARIRLPVAPTHFVDFYSSLFHAENAGRIVRPGAPPLPANWRHVPLGYHGRPGNLVVSGTAIRRPLVHLLDESGRALRRPTRLLDFELELAFVTGPANNLGEPIPIARADEHIFGVALLNDWSARDVQRFENPPLGPLMAKSFATTLAAWITPLDALRPERVAGPPQDPPPPDYLRSTVDFGLRLQLAADLRRDGQRYPLTRTDFSTMYWTMDQQLSYLTGNGARALPGDVHGSGTVSGPTADSRASLLELSEDGRHPLRFADGTEVGYLRDGDQIVLSGWAGSEAAPRLGLAEAAGVVQPAEPDD
jgi:fumarylacetoacetase